LQSLQPSKDAKFRTALALTDPPFKKGHTGPPVKRAQHVAVKLGRFREEKVIAKLK